MRLRKNSPKDININQAINLIVKNLYDFKLDKTVDKIIIGKTKQPLTGIATTFLATSDVIKKAISKGLNLVITHEPVFYNHDDETQWLKDNEVFKSKSELINENEITIWRLHDYKHRKSPDPVFKAITDRLKWGEYTDENNERIFNLPGQKLRDIISHIKDSLKLKTTRFIGNDNYICKRVGILVGAPGGKKQINFMEQNNLDLLICGEINEWEISEYIKDANFAGFKKSLIVIGHEASERDGMKLLAKRLKNIFPDIPVNYIEPSRKFSSSVI